MRHVARGHRGDEGLNQPAAAHKKVRRDGIRRREEIGTLHAGQRPRERGLVVEGGDGDLGTARRPGVPHDDANGVSLGGQATMAGLARDACDSEHVSLL